MRRNLALLAVLAFLMLTYVWLQVGLVSTGYQVEALKAQKTEFLDQHRVLQYNTLILRSPVILSKRLSQSNIHLKPPTGVEILPSVSFSKEEPPTLWTRVNFLFARWLETSRQAEAEPAP